MRGVIVYREIGHVAVGQLHQLMQDLNNLRERHRQLIAEYRALRERLITVDEAAA